MSFKPFANADPFLQLIILFLLSFVGAGLFIVVASGLVNFLWGVSFLTDPSAIQDYSNPQLVNINRVLLIFQHLGMFVMPAILFAFIMTNRVKEFLGFNKISILQMVIAVAIMLCAFPAISAMSYVNELMTFPDFLSGLEQVFMEMEESSAILTKALTGSSSTTVLMFNLLVIALLPAIGEEMIFRGLILPIIKKWSGSIHIAVWVSAILFSAMHLQFYGFIPRMVLGAILGYLYVWSGSLWTPIVAHFTNNAAALIMLFLVAKGTIPDEVDTFEPGLGDLLWLLLSIAGIVGLLLLLKRKGPHHELIGMKNQLPPDTDYSDE